ncbi:zinc finger BED domain-containing protein RICESLEEPER 2-like [Rhizophagus clarus]|uniref:Zinc finger BED domain-containing protein RICESLEEPER 2-like n=1 Tax=Rhizophagus clarus TaxID=94130 RepID=A0A8H3MAX6_9GLOM|nr:zinc finger BED domain-containing protein RICESLEEPER 2-like [Rhizophagus clarus]
MADSDRTLSGEEVDFNQLEYITEPEKGWEDTINPDESVSQVLNKNSEVDSEASTLSGSSVWLFFDKNPDSAPGYNVCKECSAKYKLSSSVTTLRKHLEKHRFKVPTKKQVVETKKKEPFKEDEQKKHDEEFINFFCPRYVIPDRHKAKDLIIESFNNQRSQIKSELHKIPGRFSLTADIWTSSVNQDVFLGLTIHYIDSNWRLCNFLLDIIPFTISHTGINISQEITRVLEEFGISNKIIALTTDNESAMLVCGREMASAFEDDFLTLTFSHYRCAAHVLNLGVKKGLKSADDSIAKARKLINTIKKSTRISNSLQTFCGLKKIKYLKLILDTEIRWNSTFYMLKRLKELEPALTLLAADNELVKSLYPSDEDWSTFKNNILLLEPLEKATVYLSASSYPTIEMATSIFEKIDEYWAIMDKYSITSAILDPRNKLSIFADELELRQHIQNIYKIYKERSSSFRPLLVSSSPASTSKNFSITESEKSELDRYLALPNEEEIEPLLWWHAHANEFPIISDMARDFLSIQATSVASEQAFSVAGNTITKTRNRLHPETARACLCVKSWITNNLAN